MSLHKLRPHQQKGLDMLRDSFKQGLTRPVFMAACGFGKTVVMAHIVASALDKGKRVMVVVPFTALINQTAKSFMDQGIPKPGIIQAQHEWTDPKNRLQIASMQTLIRRKFPDVDLIIQDESHRMYDSFIKSISDIDTPMLGFTATPYTKGMGKIFNNLIKPISMMELMDQGYLSTYSAYSHSKPDLKNVKIVKGDYDEKQAAKAMSTAKITGSIIDTWLKLGKNEPTICFATNVAHAQYLGVEFDKVKIANCVITGKTPTEERERIFKDFKKGNIKILINIGVLTTGFDSDVRCIIYAKPTKSEILWQQSIGRGLRTANGKEECVILDHSGTIQELGFPEDIDINELCNGKKNESGKVKKKSN